MKHSFPLCLDVDQHALYWSHIPGNKTGWILGAMADRYYKETGKSAHHHLAMAKAARLGKKHGFDSGEASEAAHVLLAAMPPVVEAPPAPLVPPQRIGWWVPTPEELEVGVYTVLPETFAVNDEGLYHFVQVIPGPSYPFGDNWPGIKAKWKPSETQGPFTPSPGVLEAAIAADAARVAALIARHPR